MGFVCEIALIIVNVYWWIPDSVFRKGNKYISLWLSKCIAKKKQLFMFDTSFTLVDYMSYEDIFTIADT